MKAILFLIAVVFGLAGLYLLLRAVPVDPPTKARIAIPLAKKDPRKAPSPAPVAKPPPFPVNSVSSNLGYRLDKWQRIDMSAGFLDSAFVGESPPTKADRRPLTNADVIAVKGWAGHRKFGMRLPNVLFSVCDLVIGTTEVVDARPDVAQRVHRNLGRSGWAAWLAVAHLPRCAEPVLRAWGVAPIGTLIWPLTGEVRLDLPPPPATPSEAFVTHVRPLIPEETAQPRPTRVRIPARAVNMRQCGDPECAVVAKLAGGEHEVFLVEAAGDWTLLSVGKDTGWVAKRMLAVTRQDDPANR